MTASIKPGYEKAELLDYFGTPPVMSTKFHQALVAAGVDNLQVYDALLTSEDHKTQFDGYLAFNIVGLVAAADPQQTVFAVENESRLIDASIDALSIDPGRAKGLLVFRLAEYAGAVIVHRSIKTIIERQKFPGVIFSDPADFIS